MMDELLFYLYLWFFLRPWAYLTLLMGVSKVLKFYSGSVSPSSLHFLIRFLGSLQYISEVRQDFLGDLTTSGLVAALTSQIYMPRSIRWPFRISQGGGFVLPRWMLNLLPRWRAMVELLLLRPKAGVALVEALVRLTDATLTQIHAHMRICRS